MFVSCHFVIVYPQQGGLMGKVTASVPCSHSYLFYWLILINTLDNDINTYNLLFIYFTLRLGKASWESTPSWDVFKPFSPHGSDKICDHRDRHHLQLLTYQIWECIMERRQGGAHWSKIGMSLRASAIDKALGNCLHLTTCKWLYGSLYSRERQL